MKQTIFGLLFLTSFICVSAQENKQDTLAVYSLAADQKVSWDSIYSVWTKKYFNPFLTKNKIKINCGSCTGVYLDVILAINAQGKASVVIERNNRCGARLSPDQETYFINSFTQMLFPANMRHMILRVHAGNYLKC